VLIICVYGFIQLSKHDLLPSFTQLKSLLNGNHTQTIQQDEKLTTHPTQQKSNQQTVKLPIKNEMKVSAAQTQTNEKYKPTKIQSYVVSISNGKIIVTGKATDYGQYYHASGVILDIEEPRAGKKETIKVPFTNYSIHYEDTLTYSVGDIVVNLDEYYKGKPDDPNKVLGYAQYHLTDGDPYLLPSYMVQSNNPTLDALAQNIASGKQTDVEKSQAIFAWVAKNISYNTPLANSSEPPLYSALQTYQSRVVLCSGYADLSAALHRALGIEAKVVYGENHAWNEIKLNGVWQVEDPTYGSGYINLNNNEFVHSYHPAYFSKSDKTKQGEYPW